MKPVSVQVRRFRNILDSRPVDIHENVTCLAGQNESGKTSFLPALYRLRPAPTNASPGLRNVTANRVSNRPEADSFVATENPHGAVFRCLSCKNLDKSTWRRGPTGRTQTNLRLLPGLSPNSGMSSARACAHVVIRDWPTRTQISATAARDAATQRTPAVPTPATAMPRGSAPSPRRSATTPPKPGRS